MKKEYIIYKLSDASKEACKIDNELFPMYNVKRGLRNEDGTGVLVGLTKVGNVVGYERLPEGGLKATSSKPKRFSLINPCAMSSTSYPR